MANFTILSWNVESFGEKKLAAAGQYIAKVIQAANADLVMFLESATTVPQTAIAHDMQAILEELTHQSWWAFGSEPTGKALALPPTIPYASWPRIAALGDYTRSLSPCYDDQPALQQLTRKPPTDFSPREESECRSALEGVGYVRRDLETYTGLFRFDPAVSHESSGPFLALDSYVGLQKFSGDFVSYDVSGKDIGYQIPDSSFCGRAPYVVNLYFSRTDQLGIAAAMFPLACFHAPFGSSVPPRIQANVGMMRLATRNPQNQPVALGDQPVSAVAADFNVDFNSNESYAGLTNPIPADRSPSTRNYGAFAVNSFALTINELTTLKPVQTANPAWTSSLEFRANAYDNILVRGVGPSRPIGAVLGRALDLVADTFNHAGNYLKGLALPSPLSMFDAFKIVRAQISDHLPVICQLTVADRH